MQLTCEDRDHLWAAYHLALKRYIAAVTVFTTVYFGNAEVAEARAQLDNARAEIRRHCVEHGCDPD